jgi:hypothetical protein
LAFASSTSTTSAVMFAWRSPAFLRYTAMGERHG